MICIVLLCLPLLITALLPFGSDRAFLGKGRRLQDGNSTEDAAQSNILSNVNTKVYSSGYLRIDTFDWLGENWIQAQILPIGQCFKDGSKGGSTQIAQVAMNDDAVLRTAHLFDSSDCSGEFTSVSFVQPAAEMVNQMEFVTFHVQELDQALMLNPAYNSGVVVTSYYSSDGCVGSPAQYNLVSNESAVYPDPVAAYGTITCDAEAEVMVLTMYGPYDAEAYTYAACNLDDYQDQFFEDYMFGYGYGYMDVEVVKQPFQCTDQSTTGDDSEHLPFFQTVRCIVPSADASADGLGSEGSTSSDEEDSAEV